MIFEPVVAFLENISDMPGLAIAIRIAKEEPISRSFFQNSQTDTLCIDGFHITVCVLEKTGGCND